MEIYKGDMCHTVMEDAPKPFKIQSDKYFCTLADPVPPEGDPSEDAPASRRKLRTYLQI